MNYYILGLYPQAITELNKNFEKEKDKEEKAKILNNLSAIYRQTGDYEKATQGLKQAIKIYESIKLENNITYSVALTNLAELYTAKGEFESAEPFALKSLEITSQEAPGYGSILNNVGFLYDKWGRYNKAEEYYLKTISWYQTYRDPSYIVSSSDNTLLESQYSLSLIYAKQKKYSKSQELLEKSLTLAQETLGADHPNTKELIQVLAKVKKLATTSN